MFKQSLLTTVPMDISAYADQMIRISQNAAAHTDLPPKFTALEITTATSLKMTGPRSQPPSWRCVRKTILRLRNGMEAKGSWRCWPSKRSRHAYA